MSWTRLPLLLLLGAALACVPATSADPIPAPLPAPAAGGGAAVVGKELHWVRASAEFRALIIQAYRQAGQELERTVREQALAPGSWVVIIDADETLIDNSAYQLRRAREGLGFTSESLCMQPGTSDKNPRFEAVRQGTTSAALPALRIVMFVGDNIQDFPATTQAIRDQGDEAFARFGESWIILPNPMYGSWERVPLR